MVWLDLFLYAAVISLVTLVAEGGQRGSQREAGLSKAQDAELAGSGYRMGRGWF